MHKRVSSANIVDGEIVFTYTDEPSSALRSRSEIAGLLAAIMLAREYGLSKLILITNSKYAIKLFGEEGTYEKRKQEGIIHEHCSDLAELIGRQITDGGLEIQFQFQALLATKKYLNKLNEQDRVYASLVMEANMIAESGINDNTSTKRG